MGMKQSRRMRAVELPEFCWRFSDPARIGLNQPLLLTLERTLPAALWLSLLSPITLGPELSLPLRTDLGQQGPSEVGGLCEVTSAVSGHVTPCPRCLFSLSFIVHRQLSGHQISLMSRVALFIGYDNLSR